MLKARKKVAIFFLSNTLLSEKVTYCAYSMEPSHDPVSVAIGGSFASQVGTSIPVEIVEAENAQGVLQGERGQQNVSADESMEIGEPSQLSGSVGVATDSSQPLSGVSKSTTIGGQVGMSGRTPSDQLSATSGLEVSVGAKAAGQSRLQDAAAARSAIEHFQQEVARSLGTAQNLEVAPDSIVFPQAGAGGAGGVGLVETAKRILGVNVSYGDLDISGINASVDTSLDVSSMTPGRDVTGGGSGLAGSMLNEPGSPSSTESNFDSSELLNADELQYDEMTTRLSRAGPIGIAAAAAIMTGRKRKRQHIFESNPALRKRHCSKLVRKLKDTIVELTARVGLQAAVVFYRPGKLEPKEEPSYKVFGASPLDNCLVNHKAQICTEMEAVLHQQIPPPPKEPETQVLPSDLHELPPVMFEGIPTPVHKMTQAQLRAFIPNMLKYSTGRGKPGWGKEEMKPVWWPEDIPWQNVRSDMRTEQKKKEFSWTEGLRRIVISCYLHHGRLDLLPEFSAEHLHQTISPETAQQIQIQLERLQQQHSGGGGGAAGAVVEIGDVPPVVEGEEVGGVTGGGLAEEASSSQLASADNQQVFTVDTGIGNCESAGMPTLADATLAEAAAKLQQVADETGEVQYATQTVTVTERDAKALGQPVGSVTTVLLTAYPGGHGGGGAESATDSTQQFLSPPAATTTSVPNVQVVYSASHIDTIPETLASSIASMSSAVQQQTYSTATTAADVPVPNPIMVQSDAAAQIQGSILGQSDVVAGIQSSILGQNVGMVGMQDSIMGQAAGSVRAMENPLSGQTQQNTAPSIPGSMIAQDGVGGRDNIQDSIQDSIMGQGSAESGMRGAILGQVASSSGEMGAAGVQDSNLFLNSAAGAMMGGATSAPITAGPGSVAVSDIASQLINEYVAASSQPPVPTAVFQPTPTNEAAEEPESMQTEVTPQPAPTVSS